MTGACLSVLGILDNSDEIVPELLCNASPSLMNVLDGRVRGWGTAKQSLNAKVFIKLGPMDTVARACNDAMCSLLGRRMQEPRVPRKWR